MLTENTPVKTIFMYSGQGSQYYHMGAGLYASNPVFRQHMDALDVMAKQAFGFSPRAALYAPEQRRNHPFDDTLLSSLSIFMLQRAVTHTLAHYALVPDATLSLSMGAFAALCASGAAQEEEMLVALYRQAQAMERCCEPGIMLAVLGPPTIYTQAQSLQENAEIAAVNGESHFVLALPLSALAQTETLLKTLNVPFQRMPVTRAYHSRWVDPAREAVLDAFCNVTFRPGRLPVNLCLASLQGECVSPQMMWDIARGPICLRDTVQRLESEGRWRYIDVGPSGTVATLLKYMLPAARRPDVHMLLNPMGQDDSALTKLLALAA